MEQYKGGVNGMKQMTGCSKPVSGVQGDLEFASEQQPPPLCAQTVCLGPQPSSLPPFTALLETLLSSPS